MTVVKVHHDLSVKLGCQIGGREDVETIAFSSYPDKDVSEVCCFAEGARVGVPFSILYSFCWSSGGIASCEEDFVVDAGKAEAECTSHIACTKDGDLEFQRRYDVVPVRKKLT